MGEGRFKIENIISVWEFCGPKNNIKITKHTLHHSQTVQFRGEFIQFSTIESEWGSESPSSRRPQPPPAPAAAGPNIRWPQQPPEAIRMLEIG